MTRRREVKALARRVADERRRVEAMEARWILPLAAFGTGLLFPVVTGSTAANPLGQLLAFARKLSVRALRFAVFRKAWELLGTDPRAGQ